MWKNMVQPYRPQMTKWRMHFAFWITEATNTLRIWYSDYFPWHVIRTLPVLLHSNHYALNVKLLKTKNHLLWLRLFFSLLPLFPIFFLWCFKSIHTTSLLQNICRLDLVMTDSSWRHISHPKKSYVTVLNRYRMKHRLLVSRGITITL
jgi:hypothetical protein